MKVEWSSFKAFVTTRNLSIQWIQSGDVYIMCAADGFFQLSCELFTNETNVETLDFVTNFKSLGNRKVDVGQSPFAAKTIASKKLFARTTGVSYSLAVGANTLSFIVAYPWIKINGVEIIGAELGDSCNFKVFDTAAGTYSGAPNYTLNQFGFAVQMAPGFYQRISDFDADLYQGMVLKVEYTSITAKSVGINYLITEVK